MWANDYPHHDSIWPHSQEIREEIYAGVPEAERHTMTVANAAKLYRLGNYD